MLNYNHLYYFHVVAVEGTVAAAAARLGVRAPTISEQLRSLEQTMGVTLFERTTAGLNLTADGRLVFEHTTVMFRASERLVGAISRDDRPPRTLRVGVSGTLARVTATSLLLPLIAMESCVPAIHTGDTPTLLRQLRANDLDLVLCENEQPDALSNGLEIELIDRTTLVIVAPPTVTPAGDWSDLGFLQYRPTSSYRWDVDRYLRDRGLEPRIAAESDDCSFLLEAALAGNFATAVPKKVAREAIGDGRLQVIDEIVPAHDGIHALYNDGEAAKLAKRAVATLVAAVKLTA